jgi:hypothetical protein
MSGSVRLGFGIAALFAVGVFVVWVFGNHDSWFVRAARSNAARCLTQTSCTRVDARGAIETAAPLPLPKASRCAKPENWHDRKAAGMVRITITCSDGRSYLYHMGKIARAEAGAEQWAACAEPDCAAEIRVLNRGIWP